MAKVAFPPYTLVAVVGLAKPKYGELKINTLKILCGPHINIYIYIGDVCLLRIFVVKHRTSMYTRAYGTPENKQYNPLRTSAADGRHFCNSSYNYLHLYNINRGSASNFHWSPDDQN
jgi:hypothetical protein